MLCPLGWPFRQNRQVADRLIVRGVSVIAWVVVPTLMTPLPIPVIVGCAFKALLTSAATSKPVEFTAARPLRTFVDG